MQTIGKITLCLHISNENYKKNRIQKYLSKNSSTVNKEQNNIRATSLVLGIQVGEYVLGR